MKKRGYVFIVRIKLDNNQNYNGLKIVLEDYKIVALVCKDQKVRETLIALMSGRGDIGGDCVINNLGMRENLREYKRKVDYINPREIISELTVRDYLVFFGMISGVYHEGMVEEILDMLVDVQMQGIMDRKVSELSDYEQIIVRCIASRLKKVEMLLANNIFETGTTEERKQLQSFLLKNFVENSCLCVLFENNRENIQNMVDEVILIETLQKCKN